MTTPSLQQLSNAGFSFKIPAIALAHATHRVPEFLLYDRRLAGHLLAKP